MDIQHGHGIECGDGLVEMNNKVLIEEFVEYKFSKSKIWLTYFIHKILQTLSRV